MSAQFQLTTDLCRDPVENIEVEAELAVVQFYRQVNREIAKIERQVDVIQDKIELHLLAAGEWLQLAFKIDGRIVDHCLE